MSPVAYKPNEHNTVGAIVDHVMFKKSLPEAWWQWMLEMGLWHLRELRLDVWQDVKTILLDVTDRNTCLLPTDFVDWTKVGKRVGQYCVTMGINAELQMLARTPNDPTITGLLSQHVPNGINFNAYGGFFFMNYQGSSVYGYYGGFPAKGVFKVHDAGTYKELLLDYDFKGGQVYLEYITDGFNPCGETVLNPYLSDYFLKGMEFSWEEEKNPSRTEASIYRKAQDLAWAECIVRARRNDLDPKTLLQLSRAETRLTPKI
jgi:hypothetical protein